MATAISTSGIVPHYNSQPESRPGSEHVAAVTGASNVGTVGKPTSSDKQVSDAPEEKTPGPNVVSAPGITISKGSKTSNKVSSTSYPFVPIMQIGHPGNSLAENGEPLKKPTVDGTVVGMSATSGTTSTPGSAPQSKQDAGNLGNFKVTIEKGLPGITTSSSRLPIKQQNINVTSPKLNAENRPIPYVLQPVLSLEHPGIVTNPQKTNDDQSKSETGIHTITGQGGALGQLESHTNSLQNHENISLAEMKNVPLSGHEILTGASNSTGATEESVNDGTEVSKVKGATSAGHSEEGNITTTTMKPTIEVPKQNTTKKKPSIEVNKHKTTENVSTSKPTVSAKATSLASTKSASTDTKKSEENISKKENRKEAKTTLQPKIEPPGSTDSTKAKKQPTKAVSPNKPTDPIVPGSTASDSSAETQVKGGKTKTRTTMPASATVEPTLVPPGKTKSPPKKPSTTEDVAHVKPTEPNDLKLSTTISAVPDKTQKDEPKGLKMIPTLSLSKKPNSESSASAGVTPTEPNDLELATTESSSSLSSKTNKSPDRNKQTTDTELQPTKSPISSAITHIESNDKLKTALKQEKSSKETSDNSSTLKSSDNPVSPTNAATVAAKERTTSKALKTATTHSSTTSKTTETTASVDERKTTSRSTKSIKLTTLITAATKPTKPQITQTVFSTKQTLPTRNANGTTLQATTTSVKTKFASKEELDTSTITPLPDTASASETTILTTSAPLPATAAPLPLPAASDPSMTTVEETLGVDYGNAQGGPDTNGSLIGMNFNGNISGTVGISFVNPNATSEGENPTYVIENHTFDINNANANINLTAQPTIPPLSKPTQVLGSTGQEWAPANAISVSSLTGAPSVPLYEEMKVASVNQPLPQPYDSSQSRPNSLTNMNFPNPSQYNPFQSMLPSIYETQYVGQNFGYSRSKGSSSIPEEESTKVAAMLTEHPELVSITPSKLWANSMFIMVNKGIPVFTSANIIPGE